ncbi:TPA: DNA polymerase III subunit psi [Pasteurella multocida]|uniref:DNA polymerase III subunit psi n=1 Tax=Pasteurella multocida TaxID=747 RepID=UPI000233FA78|nr:DNA polymerase III subunit psi [Pasteurella multocida]AWW59164.1 DNA polymerase III subunit psi [Pasteurellaceae bacterium 12591]AET15161.1 DNA polymerase III subunit psi [Pasteurella multocida 36950]AHE63669.1 DNA polymerase III subunit psi [Pasteurella multocida subsp. multocida str. HB03]AIN49199.1 DNA polymerase III psi subunit [Pasteurella multocida]ANJ89501.1 DNA polymerase III subunit psi [Pasteurella multocida subsp. multocida HB01]
MNRRDLLLQQMGITQWQLKSPTRLKGMVKINVEEKIRLIIVAEHALTTDSPLLKDILRSLDLDESMCLCLDFERIPHLNTQYPVHYWLLSDNQEEIERLSAFCQPATAIWQSSAWSQFKHNHHAKRQLWQQMQTTL